MKTKNKILAVVEIAIVLCSMFLVALPSIAAEQNQEMQKVSASTSAVKTASEDDSVLGIYGNANEDDTIDMRDLTYVKLIFFGKKPETELADAKYDGKINPLDFIQIKLIIVGKEKELTVVQYLEKPEYHEEPVTVPMPIGRIVDTGTYGTKTLCVFGEQDRIVGVSDGTKKRGELKPFIEDKPSIGGSFKNWDLEKIMELRPDIVLAYANFDFSDYRKQLNAADISLVQIDFYISRKYSREIRNLGWMMGNKERAEELINFEQQHIALIKERVEDLEPEQKVRVYFAFYPSYYGRPTMTAGKNTVDHEYIELCGGINIFADVEGYPVTVDPEAVIVRNPQVIYATTSSLRGYGITDTGPVKKLREDIMNYPGWDNIDAVKNEKVYFISEGASSTHVSVYLSYVAKYFHPELFKDIDPVDIHAEWHQKFLGIEHKGVYAYPYPPVS